MEQLVSPVKMQAKREFILAILAPSLIFLSGFLTYILHHDYGVFKYEVESPPFL